MSDAWTELMSRVAELSARLNPQPYPSSLEHPPNVPPKVIISWQGELISVKLCSSDDGLTRSVHDLLMSLTEKKTVRGWIWDHFETSWATWFTIRLDSPNSADGYSAHGIIAHYIKKQLGLEVEMDNRQYC
jgi:hypothetical protein